MNEREKIIRLWFDMWIKKADLGIDNIFTDDVVYTESWSPKYENRKTVKHWFDEWNTRGSVLVWEIKQFFHQGNQTIVEWYFKSKMNNGNVEEFDGISLIVWTQDNKIKSLKEFGCNLHNYNPCGGLQLLYQSRQITCRFCRRQQNRVIRAICEKSAKSARKFSDSAI